ncbi:methyltransferase domain-containing protein [Rhizobium grahamii]|uniref:Protein-L-isoaspartate O-methyltransferase n=1 Tax=Rhizobium grahamii TaxID=1120045 RepID=A0A5Q0C268_9HYPH|nr:MULTISPECIES: methyltransferase domain-containing protein [Rhizobium]QFY59602.1 methyltransferase domain-containing protein [Rhizobium grahamii]QRM47873.1 methyltransferase domain-containing protein [Rhizobium sp. BG6]
MNQEALANCRREFAYRMLSKEGVQGDEALLQAYATVPRERFLGPPPWKMAGWGGYVDTSEDPSVVYQDALFALQHERHINNGSPSLHARGIHKLALCRGKTVCHVGAGSGYYTAIMSMLVGETGHVIAIEFDGELAARAEENLRDYPNIRIVNGDGFEWPHEPADAVYVNFAVHRPADAWVERLKIGGRLILPLGVPDVDAAGPTGLASYAGFFLFRREEHGYAAEYLGPVAFVWGEAIKGGFDLYRRLEAAFQAGGVDKVRALRWKTERKGREWYSEADWGLVFDA